MNISNFSIEEIEIINILGEPATISPKEMAFFCPKCNPPHHKPKLFINRHSCQYHCFVCGYAGTGVKSLARSNGKRSRHNIGNDSDSIMDKINSIFSSKSRKEDQKKKDLYIPDGLVGVYSSKKSIVQPAIDYLSQRGFTENDIIRLRVMYGYEGDPNFSMRGRVVFPSFGLDGRPNFFVGRAIWEDAVVNYKQGPTGVSHKDIIFNELDLDWNAPVTITEGIFDSFRIFNAVPLLGKDLSPKWKLFQEIVKRNQDIVICLDSDAKEEQDRIADMFDFYGVSSIKTVSLPDGEDAGSLKRNELKDYLHQARSFSSQKTDIFSVNYGNKKNYTKFTPLGNI